MKRLRIKIIPLYIHLHNKNPINFLKNNFFINSFNSYTSKEINLYNFYKQRIKFITSFKNKRKHKMSFFFITHKQQNDEIFKENCVFLLYYSFSSLFIIFLLFLYHYYDYMCTYRRTMKIGLNSFSLSI